MNSTKLTKTGFSQLQPDDPPFLSVGTEVSAKYKGAFCEAKVHKVVKCVKIKVNIINQSLMYNNLKMCYWIVGCV